MSTDGYWDDLEAHSEAKIAIVNKFFAAWAAIICGAMSQGYAVYLDLYAGKGTYNDGTPSTPIRVIQHVIGNPTLAKKMRLVFNEANSDFVKALREAVAGIDGIESLVYSPEIYDYDVAEDGLELVHMYRNIPKMAFVDPWGYRGITRELLRALIVDWGSDCILFFNYRRVRAAIGNPKVEEHMLALFGENRLIELRSHIRSASPRDAEAILLAALCDSLRELGAQYTLPFTFRSAKDTQTTHHLVFMTKNFKGYEVMKEVMSKESSQQSQGVGSFRYCEADELQPVLFEYTRPLDELPGLLLRKFPGQTLTMSDVYMHHNVGTAFLKKHYKEALKTLEKDGRITVNPPLTERKKNTLADHCEITFPRK